LVPLPPLAEQRRIADIIDAADRLRAKRRLALVRLGALAHSIFREMFGDPISNSKRWVDSSRLGDIADIASGVTKGRKLNGGRPREVPYLAVVNVQDGHLDLAKVKTIEATESEINRYRLEKGDLLLTEGGDPDKLGRGCLWAGELPECIHQNHIFRVRVRDSRVTPSFLSWLIGSQRGKRYFLKSAKQTTGIASINLGQLRAFPLLVPPLEVQRQFGAAVDRLSEVEGRLKMSMQGLDDMFAAVQHRVFRAEP
jgi:type I restriction enzyme S subunit